MFMQLYILYNGCCRDDAPLHGAKGSCVTLKETNRSRAVLAVFFPRRWQRESAHLPFKATFSGRSQSSKHRALWADVVPVFLARISHTLIDPPALFALNDSLWLQPLATRVPLAGSLAMTCTTSLGNGLNRCLCLCLCLGLSFARALRAGLCLDFRLPRNGRSWLFH